MHRARRRQRAKLPHERLEIATVQQLHGVVERALVGDPEIEEADRVRRRQGGRGLRLALEST
jgi:hypothetical protein